MLKKKEELLLRKNQASKNLLTRKAVSSVGVVSQLTYE